MGHVTHPNGSCHTLRSRLSLSDDDALGAHCFVAGCCRVLQGVAGCCGVLQGVAVCCSALASNYYGVAMISRLLKIIGLFCKRAL